MRKKDATKMYRNKFRQCDNIQEQSEVLFTDTTVVRKLSINSIVRISATQTSTFKHTNTNISISQNIAKS